MKKLLIVLPLFLLFISCSSGQDSIINQFNSLPIEKKNKFEIDSNNCGLIFYPNKNYNKTKIEIKELRKKLSIQYKSLNDREKKRFIEITKPVFTSWLLNEIIPYWYGTEWDFNGYTSKPNVGKIACGYFVSTTLRDMGLNLNRYNLAKKNPENETQSIAISNENITKFNQDEYEIQLDSIKDGLYFIGLDNHVGYLYKYDSVTYFIHSNYIENKVMIELTSNSEAFESSIYYLTSISDNDVLIVKWLTNKQIEIIEN